MTWHDSVCAMDKCNFSRLSLVFDPDEPEPKGWIMNVQSSGF
jgi:hypothetical protein